MKHLTELIHIIVKFLYVFVVGIFSNRASICIRLSRYLFSALFSPFPGKYFVWLDSKAKTVTKHANLIEKPV
jgi:hypothetical protein